MRWPHLIASCEYQDEASALTRVLIGSSCMAMNLEAAMPEMISDSLRAERGTQMVFTMS